MRPAGLSGFCYPIANKSPFLLRTTLAFGEGHHGIFFFFFNNAAAPLTGAFIQIEQRQ